MKKSQTVFTTIILILVMFATYVLSLFASDSLATLAYDMLYYPEWRVVLLRIAVSIMWCLGIMFFTAWIFDKLDSKEKTK